MPMPDMQAMMQSQGPQQGPPMGMMDPTQQQGQGGMGQPDPMANQPSVESQMPQPGQPGQPPLPNMPERDPLANYIDYALLSTNLAEDLDDEKLNDIGLKIKQAVQDDENSRKRWMEKNKEWLKLAALVREDKTYPWPKASNVKYPLVATAAMQFSARAYPALVPSDGNIVKTKLIAQNPDDQTYQAAARIATHMSFQVSHRIPNWEEDMDKLLMTIPITGICFKKTYHSSLDKTHHSHIIYPENLIINYWAKNLDKAYRKTEILYYTKNEYVEKCNTKEFLKVDLPDPSVPEEQKDRLAADSKEAPPPDGSTPYTFWACHTFWDLDNDGYEEPYVITLEKETGKVVRIIARWDSDGVTRDPKDPKKIQAIKPIEYFTDFPFIPNPDGSIYAMGFGMLLGPLNESVNTLINQLVDSGTLSNMQSGFIGKGLRLRAGQVQIQPGEWQVVNATGDDLSKSIYPLPAKEPSGTLFQLLNLLIQSGNQLASIAEIFVGKMPGQNTPATTTQETVQQSMAVFTAIYKRVYRSLAKEFRKLYRLNRVCPDCVAEEQKIGGIPMQASDYDLPDWTIVPGADPTGDSTTVKLAKLQQVGQLLSMGTINPMVYTKMMLEANETPNADQLMQQPPPPQPDPKQQTEAAKTQQIQMKTQADSQKAQQTAAAKQQELSIKERLAEIDLAMKAAEQRHQETLQAMEAQGVRHQQAMDLISKVLEQHFQTQKGQGEILQSQAKHELSMQQTRDKQQAKVKK